jgi:hypothetical protein
LLKDIGRTLPAGGYEVLTDEELIEGLSFPVYRRVSTMMMVPAPPPRTSSIEMLVVDPRELQLALDRDAAMSLRRPVPGLCRIQRRRPTVHRRFARGQFNKAFLAGINKHSGPLSIQPAAFYVQITPVDELRAGAERRDSAPAHTGGACAQLSSLSRQQ